MQLHITFSVVVSFISCGSRQVPASISHSQIGNPYFKHRAIVNTSKICPECKVTPMSECKRDSRGSPPRRPLFPF